MAEKLLTLAEMAALLGVHPQTLRDYVRSKRVRFYRLPAEGNYGELRFDPLEVREDLRNNVS